jgi:lysophospholipase L1-like esterase
MSMERIRRAQPGWVAVALCLAGCAFAMAGTKPRRPGPRPPARAEIQNAQALAPFFGALARLEEPRQEPAGQPRVVRVHQFGDSHTAADFWTARVRERLQARFGDGGPGCILSGRPWRGYPHPGVSIVAGLKWPAQSLRSRECDGLVGLPGASLAPVPGEAFRLRAAFGGYRVHVLGAGPGTVSASLTGVPGTEPEQEAAVPPPPPLPVPMLADGDDPRLALFGEDGLAADTPRELSLWLPDTARLLGIDLLSGRPGVVYDELGLNGAEILDLDRWDPGLRRALLAQTRPSLLVLAYGTNDMGMSAQALADYPAAVQRLLEDLRAASGAPILVVGPLDRLGRSRGPRPALKAGAATIIQSLRQASAGAGCAFWDARQAMGGYGTLLKWRRAGLAQPDLVHLNGGGYQKLGDLMADALLVAYDQYRHPPVVRTAGARPGQGKASAAPGPKTRKPARKRAPRP